MFFHNYTTQCIRPETPRTILKSQKSQFSIFLENDFAYKPISDSLFWWFGP